MTNSATAALIAVATLELHPEARFPMMTGVLETRTTLFLTTLNGNRLSYIPKEDLL